jgi:hypothetical protein
VLRYPYFCVTVYCLISQILFIELNNVAEKIMLYVKLNHETRLNSEVQLLNLKSSEKRCAKLMLSF